MSYNCEILADSVSKAGYRLTTFCVTFPRFILAEVNTHRMLSRNSASSRAIPVEKSIAAIEEAMFIPAAFGANQRGMQADLTLDERNASLARAHWVDAGRMAIHKAYALKDLGVHKAWANRILETYKWHTAIVTATEWSNFFALRTHKDAQPEFREIALMMQGAYRDSYPIPMGPASWHTPLVTHGELTEGFQRHAPDWDLWRRVSIGRCARVSVETHDGKREVEADVALHDRLLPNHHLSPFEHVARPFSDAEWRMVRALQDTAVNVASAEPGVHREHAEYLHRLVEFQGNLRGWHSARMDVPNEDDYGRVC